MIESSPDKYRRHLGSNFARTGIDRRRQYHSSSNITLLRCEELKLYESYMKIQPSVFAGENGMADKFESCELFVGLGRLASPWRLEWRENGENNGRKPAAPALMEDPTARIGRRTSVARPAAAQINRFKSTALNQPL